MFKCRACGEELTKAHKFCHACATPVIERMVNIVVPESIAEKLKGYVQNAWQDMEPDDTADMREVVFNACCDSLQFPFDPCVICGKPANYVVGKYSVCNDHKRESEIVIAGSISKTPKGQKSKNGTNYGYGHTKKRICIVCGKQAEYYDGANYLCYTHKNEYKDWAERIECYEKNGSY